MTSAATLDQSLREFATLVEEELDALQENIDFPEAAQVFDAINLCITELGTVRRKLARHLAESTDAKRTEVEGLGVVEVNWNKPRRGWDWPLLVSAIVARATDEPATLFDPESGEVLPPAVIGENIARVLVACVGLSYGKAGGLLKLGLERDSYCILGDWEPQVKVTR